MGERARERVATRVATPAVVRLLVTTPAVVRLLVVTPAVIRLLVAIPAVIRSYYSSDASLLLLLGPLITITFAAISAFLASTNFVHHFALCFDGFWQAKADLQKSR